MDDPTARQLLRDRGEDPPKRGRLGEHWHALADEYAATPGSADYDGGVSAADFPGEQADDDAGRVELPRLDGAADLDGGPVEPAAVIAPERRPRRPRRPARKPLRERLAARQAKAKAKPKRKGPRLSLADLITDAWAGLGGAIAYVNPPLGTVLQIEAPLAGPVLDDVVKDTFADPVLQVAAAYQQKVKLASALFLPPALVLAAEQAATLPEQQRAARMALIEPLLDRSLVMLARLMGERADQLTARLEAEAPAREEAAKLKALIWRHAGVPEPAAEPAAV